MLLSMLLTACGSTTTEKPSTPSRGGTLTIAAADEPTSLDPPQGGSRGEASASVQIFDQLVEVAAGPDAPKSGVKPDLAQSWETSADGLTYTFHLRKARFSNGASVTSSDVVFSLKRTMDPKAAPAVAPVFAFIKSVTNPDPATVVVKLKRPTPAALNFLALTTASVIPKAYFERVGAKRFAERPIGSGAFKLDRWNRANELVLSRNPHYWRRGLPYLDKVVVKYIPDGNARNLALKSGSVDVNDNVAYSQIASLQAQPNIKVQAQDANVTFAVVLNMNGDPALSERAVRQALNYATPKSAIAKVVFNNKARIANSIIPPLQHWDRNIPPYAYDLDKAKQLIAGSKAANGLSLTMEVLSGNDAALQTATILQRTWAKIGVKVDVRQVPTATLFQDFSGKADAEIWDPIEWASGMSAEDEWGGLFSTLFKSLLGYENKKLDSLIDQATSTLDASKRQSLWTAVQKESMEDAPWVPLVYPSLTSAVRSNVSGFGFLPGIWWQPLDTASVQ